MSASFEEFKKVCKHRDHDHCRRKDLDGMRCGEYSCPYSEIKETTGIDRIVDNYIERKNGYSKCKSYIKDDDGRCLGTKEMDRVGCEGNEFNCKLYKSVRERAKKKFEKEHRDFCAMLDDEIQKDSKIGRYKPQPTPEPTPLYQGYLQPDELLKAISNYKKKKVYKYYDFDKDGEWVLYTECPTCYSLVGLRNENYCAHCGQHLDWGEEE